MCVTGYQKCVTGYQKCVTNTTNDQSTQLYFTGTKLHVADRSVHYQVHKDLKYLL